MERGNYMKGHVKLELFDKNGSLVEKREDHNMMTNFLNDWLLPIATTRQCAMGSYGSSRSGLSTGWLLRLFGAIQLFEEPLSEDANDYLPNGQKIIGLSRYSLGYSGTYKLYGSYNATESVWSDDRKTFKFVYDFPTSQANGTISSLGLSPISSAYGGLGAIVGDSSVNFATDLAWDFSADISTSNPASNTLVTTTQKHTVYFDYENNFEVGVPYAVLKTTSDNSYIGKTSKIPLNLYQIPLSKFQMGYRIGVGDSSAQQVLDTKYMTMKNTLNASSANYGFINFHKGKIYACFTNSSSWAKNTSLIMTCMNTDTWEESFITITNTTGQTIYLGSCVSFSTGNATHVKNSAFCIGDYLLVVATDKKIYTINTSDNTDVKMIKYVNSDFSYVQDTSYMNVYFGMNNTVYFSCWNNENLANGKPAMFYADLKNAQGGMIIQEDHVGNFFTTNNARSLSPVKNHPSLWMGWTKNDIATSYHNFIHGVFSSLVLSTKMNLKEPVVKTSDLSMKVTYSLTFNND